MKFNLSYSSLTLYRESPRTFYYAYIKKLSPPDPTIKVYGDAGNVVHNALENLIKKKPYNIEREWVKKKLNTINSFNGRPLSLPDYKLCYENGKRVIQNYQLLNYKLTPEGKYLVEYEPGIWIKGFVDVKAINGRIILIDWKTDNSFTKGKHREQRLFYSWLHWLENKTIPDKCVWHYLKLGKSDDDSFTLKEIEDFHKQMVDIIEEIKQKGMKEENYEIGDITSPFNAYKSLMGYNPENGDYSVNSEPLIHKIILTTEHARIYVDGLEEDFLKTISDEFSYEVKDSFFIKRALASKGARFDGMKRFYKIGDNSLPIGFLNRLKKFLTKNGYEYEIIDKRAELKDYNMIDKIQGVELRDYQKKAVEHILDKKITFVEIATSGGKTAIAAEVIRRTRGLTIFVVDRNVLLTQTKKEFEKFLGEDIGTITEGQINLKKINVATIQTLVSLLERKNKEITKILANVKTLIIDEGHTVAAKSFMELSKWMSNAIYRIGMSGTFERPDGNSMMIESVVGNVEFKINAKQLIDSDYIMKPKIAFIKVNSKSKIGDSYSDYYNKNIVENEKRNKIIIDLTLKNPEKKKLILVSKLIHGEYFQKNLPGSVFIQGNVEHEVRDEWIDAMKNDKLKIIIGTVSIIGKGLNIPNLDVLINATGNLSSITTIQSLGRILRKNKDKEQPIYIDFVDDGKYLYDHSLERMGTLRQQGHEVKILS